MIGINFIANSLTLPKLRNFIEYIKKRGFDYINIRLLCNGYHTNKYNCTFINVFDYIDTLKSDYESESFKIVVEGI
jgi:hypothetical protein